MPPGGGTRRRPVCELAAQVAEPAEEPLVDEFLVDEPLDGFLTRMTTSLASLLLPMTCPPTNTQVPEVRSLLVTGLPLSLTTELLATFQLHSVPLAALTTSTPPLD